MIQKRNIKNYELINIFYPKILYVFMCHFLAQGRHIIDRISEMIIYMNVKWESGPSRKHFRLGLVRWMNIFELEGHGYWGLCRIERDSIQNLNLLIFLPDICATPLAYSLILYCLFECWLPEMDSKWAMVSWEMFASVCLAVDLMDCCCCCCGCWNTLCCCLICAILLLDICCSLSYWIICKIYFYLSASPTTLLLPCLFSWLYRESRTTCNWL